MRLFFSPQDVKSLGAQFTADRLTTATAYDALDRPVTITSFANDPGEADAVRLRYTPANLLDRVDVDYYGVVTPLKQLAQIAATDARLLTLTPFDKNSIGAIEKAIL